MKNSFLLLASLLCTYFFQAQKFDASLQLRPRFEYRNGYKSLLEKEQEPATFVSQRSRINFGFSNENLQMKFSLQNIRVWGEVPTMTTFDQNGIGVFEGWGQYAINPSFKIKLGRQVLSYDNQRIFGEVDWAQQAQSHDAALLKFIPAEEHSLDIGVALNAQKEDVFKNPYLVNSYKNMQFGWYHINSGSSKFSFLVLNAGYETELSISKREIQYIQTYGSYIQFSKSNWTGDISAYGQTGEKSGKDLNAWYGGANLNYKFSPALIMGTGAEYLTGTDMGTTSEELQSFTPLFGTNHAFNGFMDYFYVGNHQNSVGLIDVYGKFSFAKGKFGLILMPHYFASEAKITDENLSPMDSYLGTEIDLTGSWKLSKDATIALGYSQMFGTKSLQRLKGGDPDSVQNWAWISVNFHPTLFSISLNE